MNAAIRSELLKLRTTRTLLGLVTAMTGLVVLSVTLHSLGLAIHDLSDKAGQLRVLDEAGVGLAALFAGLVGVMSITSEVRYGTIRPTFLGIPRRGRVIAAKAAISVVVGVVIGLAATALAATVGTVAMSARGIDVHLSAGDYARIIAGGAGASALWAAIGLGVGTIVRNQVASIVGMFVWLEIIENLLNDSISSVSRYMPGALAQSISAQRSGLLQSCALAVALLCAYAAAAAAIGWKSTLRRDFA